MLFCRAVNIEGLYIVISVFLPCRLQEVRFFSIWEDQTFRETAVKCYVKHFDFFSCRARYGSCCPELFFLHPPAVLSSFPYTEKVPGKELTQKIFKGDIIPSEFRKVGKRDV